MYSAIDVILIVIAVIVVCEVYREISIKKYEDKIKQYKDAVSKQDKIIYKLTKDILELKKFIGIK